MEKMIASFRFGGENKNATQMKHGGIEFTHVCLLDSPQIVHLISHTAKIQFGI